MEKHTTTNTPGAPYPRPLQPDHRYMVQRPLHQETRLHLPEWSRASRITFRYTTSATLGDQHRCWRNSGRQLHNPIPRKLAHRKTRIAVFRSSRSRPSRLPCAASSDTRGAPLHLIVAKPLPLVLTNSASRLSSASVSFSSPCRKRHPAATKEWDTDQYNTTRNDEGTRERLIFYAISFHEFDEDFDYCCSGSRRTIDKSSALW